MLPKVRVRAGIPRFARRLRSGEPVTVVAFGTSMTAHGEFVSHVREALAALPGAGAVTFVNAGMRGFVTLNAVFRARDAVAAHAPDLVLIEFSHNDVTELALGAIRPAVTAIMMRIWEVQPACEFVFVYLAQHGQADDGPTAAIVRYEALADELGIASIDCAAFVESLVRDGVATWSGGDRPLTRDGTHFGPLATDLVGRPFADALSALVNASSGPERGAPPPLASRLLENDVRPATAFAPPGVVWAHCPPLDHEARIAEAYSGSDVLANLVPGAAFRVPFEGTMLLGWVTGTGGLTASGTPPLINVSFEFANPHGWRTTILAAASEPTRAEVTLTATSGTLIFGDLSVAGRFL